MAVEFGSPVLGEIQLKFIATQKDGHFEYLRKYHCRCCHWSNSSASINLPMAWIESRWRESWFLIPSSLFKKELGNINFQFPVPYSIRNQELLVPISQLKLSQSIYSSTVLRKVARLTQTSQVQAGRLRQPRYSKRGVPPPPPPTEFTASLHEFDSDFLSQSFSYLFVIIYYVESFNSSRSYLAKVYN